jgi:pimeloyl-ACP methyl ester carboxylesterase
VETHEEKKHMSNVISRDGTTIAFDRSGRGPALILVTGALTTRADWAPLAAHLAPHFTVFTYDRRGRGQSGDTAPSTGGREAVEREVEDLAVLLDEAGGSAYVFGHSSGAALALEATLQLGEPVKKLALYEPPYNDDPAAQRAWSAYLHDLSELLAADRRGDAIALFRTLTGTPPAQIDAMRQAPFWAALEALAPTLAYDHTALLGPDAAVPTETAARVRVPTLVIVGGASFPFMGVTAHTLVDALPNGQLATLDGQTHTILPEILAPVLVAYFNG